MVSTWPMIISYRVGRTVLRNSGVGSGKCQELKSLFLKGGEQLLGMRIGAGELLKAVCVCKVISSEPEPRE